MSKTKIIISSLVLLGVVVVTAVYFLLGKNFERMPTVSMPAGSIVGVSTLVTSATRTPITTPGNTCLNFTVDMQYGDSDSKEFKGIATLQKFLQEKGYYDKDLPINGNYATSTGEATIKLRRDLEVKYGNPKRELSDYEKYNFSFEDRWMLRLETGCNMDLTLKQVFEGMKREFYPVEPEPSIKTLIISPYVINYDTSKVKDSVMRNSSLSLQNTVYVSSAKRYGYIVEDYSSCFSSCYRQSRYITFDGVKFRNLEECSFTAKQSAYEYFTLDSLIVCSSNASEYVKYIIDKNLNITEKKEVVGSEYDERGFLKNRSCPDKELEKYFTDLCGEVKG